MDQNQSDEEVQSTSPATQEDFNQDVENQSIIPDLVEILQSVDTNTEEAQLNTSSMDDNNGGRIEFNEDYPNFNRIK